LSQIATQAREKLKKSFFSSFSERRSDSPEANATQVRDFSERQSDSPEANRDTSSGSAQAKSHHPNYLFHFVRV
jgi:hypothetical protein